MTRKKFTPARGEVYQNAGGGEFVCLASYPSDAPGIAVMQNVKSGWACLCKGCGVYDDGKIDWDYSLDGMFMRLPEAVRREAAEQ